MFIIKFLAMWTLLSIAAGLVVGPALKRLRSHDGTVELTDYQRKPKRL